MDFILPPWELWDLVAISFIKGAVGYSDLLNALHQLTLAYGTPRAVLRGRVYDLKSWHEQGGCGRQSSSNQICLKYIDPWVLYMTQTSPSPVFT